MTRELTVSDELFQNYANPVNPNTKIIYRIPREGKVVIKFYHIFGAEVFSLVDEKKEPGYFEVDLNRISISSGLYFYKMIAGDFVETKKIILLL